MAEDPEIDAKQPADGEGECVVTIKGPPGIIAQRLFYMGMGTMLVAARTGVGGLPTHLQVNETLREILGPILGNRKMHAKIPWRDVRRITKAFHKALDEEFARLERKDNRRKPPIDEKDQP